MNRSGVNSALRLIVGSVLIGFFGKVFAVGGLLSLSVGTLVIGLGMALLSPILMGVGVLYAVYSFLSRGSTATYESDMRVFAPEDSRVYCRNCGKVIHKDGKFCRYCGREQF